MRALIARASHGAYGSRSASGFLTAVEVSRRELGLAAGWFAALGFGVFGIHIARGGFMFDDWTLAYDVRRALDSGGMLEAFGDLWSGDILTGNSAGRPTEAAYNVLLYTTFGQHAALHVAWAILVAAMVSFLFYIVLRRVALERLHSVAIATLVLLFPAADSSILWATGSIARSSAALCLAGMVCGLAALRRAAGEQRRCTVSHGCPPALVG